MLLHNKIELKKTRQALRKNATPSEAALWKALKGKQLNGRKFRRQHSIGDYVVDFYCPSEKLVLELDGDSHYSESGILRDEKRDSFLESLGFKVLRIENQWIFKNEEGVLELIRSHFD